MELESFFDDNTIATYVSIGFTQLYPRRTVLLSGICSAIIALGLSAGLLQGLGIVDPVSTATLSDLMSIRAYAVVAAATSLAVVLSMAFWYIAVSDVVVDDDTLYNPFTYLGAMVVMLVIQLLVYGVVSGLTAVSGLLAFVVAGLITVARHYSETYWGVLATSKAQIALFSLLALAVPVVAVVGAAGLGLLPEWTLGEWSIALVYALTAYVTVTAPTSTMISFIDTDLKRYASVLALTEQTADRVQSIEANLPFSSSIDVDVPSTPESYSEAMTIYHTADPAALQRWFASYEAYIEACDSLSFALDGDVESAADGDDGIGATLATVARNLHPNNYEDPKTAERAAEVLDTLADEYGRHPSDDPSSLADPSVLRRFADIVAPDDAQLDDLATAFEDEAPTPDAAREAGAGR